MCAPRAPPSTWLFVTTYPSAVITNALPMRPSAVRISRTAFPARCTSSVIDSAVEGVCVARGARVGVGVGTRVKVGAGVGVGVRSGVDVRAPVGVGDRTGGRVVAWVDITVGVGARSERWAERWLCGQHCGRCRAWRWSRAKRRHLADQLCRKLRPSHRENHGSDANSRQQHKCR